MAPSTLHTAGSSSPAAGEDTSRTIDMSDSSDIELENCIASPEERRGYYLDAIREDSESFYSTALHGDAFHDPLILNSNYSRADCCEQGPCFCCPPLRSDAASSLRIENTKKVLIATLSTPPALRQTDDNSSISSSQPDLNGNGQDLRFFELAPTIFQ